MSKSKTKKHKEAHWYEVMQNIDSSMVALWQKVPLIEAENKELLQKINKLKKLCKNALSMKNNARSLVIVKMKKILERNGE